MGSMDVHGSCLYFWFFRLACGSEAVTNHHSLSPPGRATVFTLTLTLTLTLTPALSLKGEGVCKKAGARPELLKHGVFVAGMLGNYL